MAASQIGEMGISDCCSARSDKGIDILAYTRTHLRIIGRFGPRGSPQLGRLGLAAFTQSTPLPMHLDLRAAKAWWGLGATRHLVCGQATALPLSQMCGSSGPARGYFAAWGWGGEYV